MMGQVIDWTLTERVAGMLAGDPERGTPRPRLNEVAAKSERLVSAYAGLEAPAPLPEPELLTRPEWVRANLRSLQPTLEPLAGRLGDGLGPATPIVRAAGRSAARRRARGRRRLSRGGCSVSTSW